MILLIISMQFESERLEKTHNTTPIMKELTHQKVRHTITIIKPALNT